MPLSASGPSQMLRTQSMSFHVTDWSNCVLTKLAMVNMSSPLPVPTKFFSVTLGPVRKRHTQPGCSAKSIAFAQP